MNATAQTPDTAASVPHRDAPSREALVREELDRIRPSIQADGGDMEFVELAGGVVKVRLLGACTDCPSSILTLKAGIEARLVQAVPGIERVETT